MAHRTIDVIGGGPAGLAAARLIKLADPSARVTVHERSDSSTATFGFGVSLTESTMRNLAAVDPATAEEIRRVSYAGHSLTLRGADRDVQLHGARNLAIGRAALLQVLTDAATAVGVDIRMGSRVDFSDTDADVVIAADGARSAVRDKLSAELGVRISYGSLHYMWCGADFAVDTAYFAARSLEGSLFVTHAYPYADDRSTFLIEADEQTWASAGLASNEDGLAPGETDEASVRLLERAFAGDLRGRTLLTNRTRWARFPTVSLDRWSYGNVVVLGDAAHTAHYTIGSGTKLALEDAIALSAALAENSDVTQAFTQYEAARRPGVDRFKHLAARSQGWWSSYRFRHEQSPELVALSYMTRAGNLTVADYAADHPGTVREALRDLGDAPVSVPAALDDWILSRPLEHAALTRPRRELDPGSVPDGVRRITWSDGDVGGERAADLRARLRTEPETTVVLLEGPDDAPAVGARIDMAERLRWDIPCAVLVALPDAARPEGAAAVAAGRCHAVVIA
ncbi:MAG: FAD-dependent monooxygenase [Rhodococcus sp. (in: high G+C Gram-positive bacteria)]